jgi:flagellar protein FliS
MSGTAPDVRDAAARYAADSVGTASGPQLILMLYDRLLADLEFAQQGIARGAVASAHELLAHAREIIVYLRATLRVELFAAGRELAALYDYLARELALADAFKDGARVAHVLEIVASLAAAWREAARRAATAVAGAAAVGAPAAVPAAVPSAATGGWTGTTPPEVIGAGGSGLAGAFAASGTEQAGADASEATVGRLLSTTA